MSSEAAPRPLVRRGWVRAAALYGLIAVLLVPFVVPLWWMVTTSVKPAFEVFAFPPTLLPQTWRWENYAEVFRIRPLACQYANSLYIAVLVTGGTLAVASATGYAFARIRFRGASLCFLLLLSALLVPDEVTIVPLYQLMQTFGWLDSHIPLVVLPVLGSQAVVGVFLMRQYFLGLPAELEEAGRVDGLGRFGLFWYIALPLAKPALAALTILSFLNSWNLFLEPLIFLRDRALFTLPIALTTYTDTTGTPLWHLQLAATTVTVLPVVAVFMAAQRHFISGITAGGLKG